MYYHTNFICFPIIVFVIFVNKSIGVSILQDNKNNHQLVPIKLTPVVEEVQQLSEKSNEFITGKTNDFFEKRDNNKKKIQNLNDTDNGGDDDVKQKEITTRKISGGSFLMKDESHCCGSRFQVSDRLEDSQLTTIATGTRYSESFHNRPDNDRYGWQTYPRPGGSTSSTNSLYGSQGNSPDRYGSRPSYGQSEFGRPSVLNSLKPLRPGYDYGNSDSGAYGSNGYEVDHRPGQGNSGGIYFTGYNRPPGNYSVYGSNAAQDEFPPAEGPPQPTNIHTQKAVALKALAGVALLGAAAALAANPVLLPLSVVAGKKKRSTTSWTFDHLDLPYKFILDHVPQIQENNIAQKFWSNKACLSRLICERQHEFDIQINQDKPFIQDGSIIKRHIDRKLNELIFKGILQPEDLHESSKMLMTILNHVEDNKNGCNVFVCNLYNP